MTDEQEARYLELVAPIREAYLAEQYRLESEAEAGILRSGKGLEGILCMPPLEYIEECWQDWLSRALARAFEKYQADCRRIEGEVVAKWQG